MRIINRSIINEWLDVAEVPTQVRPEESILFRIVGILQRYLSTDGVDTSSYPTLQEFVNQYITSRQENSMFTQQEVNDVSDAAPIAVRPITSFPLNFFGTRRATLIAELQQLSHVIHNPGIVSTITNGLRSYCTRAIETLSDPRTAEGLLKIKKSGSPTVASVDATIRVLRQAENEFRAISRASARP